MRIPADLQTKLILSVGTHRGERPLAPIECAQAIKADLDLGSAARSLAAELQIGVTMIGRFLRLLSLPQSVHHLVDWGCGEPGRLSFTVASHVARLRDPLVQERLVKATLEHSLTSSEVQQTLMFLKAGRAYDEAIEAVLRLRPTVERLYLFIGAVDGRLRTMLSRMSQPERDRTLSKSIAQGLDGPTPVGTRLGIERFSVMGDKHFSDFIVSIPGGFEAAVNRLLTQEVHG